MAEKRLHTYRTWVSFGDVDSSGRIYFVRLFEMAHRCIEDFAIQNDLFDSWFKNQEWFTPVRHTEADYYKPLSLGDPLEIHLYGDSKGANSFTWRYVFLNGNEIVGQAKITHVSMDLETKGKCEVPQKLAQFF